MPTLGLYKCWDHGRSWKWKDRFGKSHLYLDKLWYYCLGWVGLGCVFHTENGPCGTTIHRDEKNEDYLTKFSWETREGRGKQREASLLKYKSIYHLIYSYEGLEIIR